MKMKESGKVDEQASRTNEGEYTHEDLEAMLDMYVKVKEIDSDPAKKRLLMEFAESKGKQISALFDEDSEEPKSLDDLKKIRQKKIDAEV